MRPADAEMLQMVASSLIPNNSSSGSNGAYNDNTADSTHHLVYTEPAKLLFRRYSDNVWAVIAVHVCSCLKLMAGYNMLTARRRCSSSVSLVSWSYCQYSILCHAMMLLHRPTYRRDITALCWLHHATRLFITVMI
jgi:hypothetical protein